ncbi:MAG: NUDIX domain-containing protein [Calditrichota bacterium]
MLKRSDAGWWQFVAGGGEDSESPLQAAERETLEETGLPADGRLIPLDSLAVIPRDCFAAADSGEWGAEVIAIPEYCFAIEVGDSALVLSGEHTEARWVSSDEACCLLKWDSNRNALWKVKERVKKQRS